MQQSPITLEAFDKTGTRTHVLTFPNAVLAQDTFRSFSASNPRVVNILVTPRLALPHDRIDTFFHSSDDATGDVATFTRAADNDPRLDLPEVGTIGDLEGFTDALRAAGIDADFEHPGVVVARIDTTEVALDFDAEYRLGVYSGMAYSRGEDSDTGLMEFAPTMAGRRAAMAQFMLQANAAAPVTLAPTSGVLDRAGYITRDGITVDINGTIVAVEGHPTVPPIEAPALEDEMTPLERLVSELEMDEDGIRTVVNAIKRREGDTLTQDEREYIDGILIPMSKRLLGYLAITAASRTEAWERAGVVLPATEDDDRVNGGDLWRMSDNERAEAEGLEYEDSVQAFGTFAEELRAMHDRLEVIRATVTDAQADENENSGYISGILRMAGVALATVADEAADSF